MSVERKILLTQIVLHTIFIILGIVSFVSFGVSYMTMETEVMRYFISDGTLILLAGVMQLFIGIFLSIQSIAQWRLREAPESCNGACVWFVFILASAVLLGISIALPASMNDDTGLLNDLEDEASNNISSGLLDFGHYKTGCCGVYRETICQKDYPPFVYLNNYTEKVSLCPRGSTHCENDCSDAIWENFMYPYKIDIGTIGITTLVGLILEFFLPSALRRIFWRQLLVSESDRLQSPASRPPIRTSDPNLDAKIKTFYDTLYGGETQRTGETIQLTVYRNSAFEHSVEQLLQESPSRWKLRFKISFADEDGLDYGGLLKEWFTIVIRQLFNQNFALFRKMKPDGVAYTIDEKSSFVQANCLRYYKFAGLLVAKALFEKIPLGCFLTQFLYKKLLGLEVEPADLKLDDASYYANIAGLMDLSDEDLQNAELYFVSEISAFGEVIRQTDLAPFDRNTRVTRENVKEYVDAMCLMKMTGEIEEQLKAFLEGFHSLIPKQAISPFTPQELELLLCGLQAIEVGEIKPYAMYLNCSRDTSQVVWFWKALESFSHEERVKLLRFVTGNDRVPLGGFCGSDGGQQFTIMVLDEAPVDQLPTAHTCFNRIELAQYPSYDVLRERLLKAITECDEGFGLK